jgi:hypothetical protein
MKTRTLSTAENMIKFWNNQSIEQVLAELDSNQKS